MRTVPDAALLPLMPIEMRVEFAWRNAEQVKHHPLCTVQRGGYCDYDCARDYHQGAPRR